MRGFVNRPYIILNWRRHGPGELPTVLDVVSDKKKGWVSDKELADFAKAGVGRAQIYEIIAAIGLKTISNYVSHINKTEVDPVFLP